MEAVIFFMGFFIGAIVCFGVLSYLAEKDWQGPLGK